jgi:hypothetical protein
MYEKRHLLFTREGRYKAETDCVVESASISVVQILRVRVHENGAVHVERKVMITPSQTRGLSQEYPLGIERRLEDGRVEEDSGHVVEVSKVPDQPNAQPSGAPRPCAASPGWVCSAFSIASRRRLSSGSFACFGKQVSYVGGNKFRVNCSHQVASG